MEEQLNPLAATHLLQHTLRSLCIHKSSHWVYAVFWRILPRNYPPPKWDLQRGFYDRTGGNRRNWILAWEDGFCNFAASTCEQDRQTKGLHPDLFFKMSHEIYNYGEGLIGTVAADHSHKWVFDEPQDHDTSYLSTWSNATNSQPRTWEAQFQSGVQTIALIAVREGVVQLGSLTKVTEDLSFVILLRKNFNFLESIPGVLLPHPSSSAFPVSIDRCGGGGPQNWPVDAGAPLVPAAEFYEVTPSMSSLESLLSKLPPVVPPPEMPVLMQKPSPGVMEAEKVAKEEYAYRSGILELDGHETPNSSPSFTYDSYTGFREPDSLKSAANKGPRIRSSSRRTVKKRHNREERQIDKEYDAVLVPSDGGCMSGTDSDDSDWSIGWSEPLDPEFHSEKEANDSFAVLVPCYGRRRLEQVVSSKKHVLGSVDLRDADHYDGKRDIEQWLAEQLST